MTLMLLSLQRYEEKLKANRDEIDPRQLSNILARMAQCSNALKEFPRM